MELCGDFMAQEKFAMKNYLILWFVDFFEFKLRNSLELYRGLDFL